MPRNGLGIPMVSSSVGGAIINVNDVLWESFGSNEIAINYAENYTNIILHSQDATDAEAWTKTNTAIDSTLYEAPDNSTTANAIKSDSTGTKVYRILQGTLSVTTGKTYTLSTHVKKGTLGFARVQFNDGSVDYRADFNLNTAAVTNATNTIRTQVDSMDDDWYRCSVTFKAQNTANGSSYVFAQSAAGSSTPSVAVSGVILLYVWGWQLEENIEASPYIVTTTEARTATETLNDLSSVWDFDSADLMPQETPSSEGVWETSDNLVLNHDYEELGSELITNGDFSSGSTGWENAFGGQWVISGGKATLAVGVDGSYLSAGTILTAGKNYKAVITTSGGLDSNNKVTIYATSNTGQKAESDGTHTFYFTADNTTFRFLGAANDRPISIDSVSVKQVDPNDRWVLGTGWSIEDGTLIYTGTSNSNTEQAGILTTNTNYELTYTVVTASGDGTLKLFGETTSTTNNLTQTVGTHTKIFFTDGANGTDFGFRVTGNTSGSFVVDNVTIREYAIQPQDV